MFELFDSQLKRVRRLRAEFEDIRQRVLYKMNGYEQYSFASTYLDVFENVEPLFQEASANGQKYWLALADKLKAEALQAWNSSKSMGGIAGEGGVAGSEALALLYVKASANAYVEAEAKILQSDVANFEAKVSKFINERQGIHQMISKD